MSVTFGLPILVRFLLYTPNSLLFMPIFPVSSNVQETMWVGLCRFSLICGKGERMLNVRMKGVRGNAGNEKSYAGVCTKIILVRDLFCQAEAQSQIPFRFPVLQGTGEASYMDHV